ncbi:MAG: hypothetical protein M3P08_13375, partial [Thermoproteota archaeon]|nr:hypothetical protein [Thermoproteota archaeon]
MQWSPISAPGTFEQVNERYAVQSGTLMNNDNFRFFTDVWHNIAHGYVLSTRYDSNNNPLDTIVKFVNVLNPITHGTQNYQDMRFGTNIITPPFSSNDNGQHRNFLITNEVPSGYYIVNVLGKFGGTFGVVYTGKMFIPGTSGPPSIDNQHSVTRVMQTGGSDPCHPGQVFDHAVGECIGDAAPPTHAVGGPTGGPTCTAIQHLDPTYHVCVPLGLPFPPNPNGPWPGPEAGAENCPSVSLGFNSHLGVCAPPGGVVCPAGSHVIPPGMSQYAGYCDFNVQPPLGPDHIHLVADNSVNVTPVTSGPTPPCSVDPTT